MALYRLVSMGFWTDPDVMDEFTPEDRYFYLYLLTNPHTNLAGCYEVSRKQIAGETGYSTDVIENLLKRFESVHNVVRYCRETKEVLLLNWHRYNWTASDKYRKPLQKEIAKVKCQEFKEYLQELFDGGTDTVSIPYPYGTDTTNAITNTITNSNSNSNSIVKYIADLYNSICVSFPRLVTLSEARKKAIKARLKTYQLGDFEDLFIKAEASDFLKGKNDRNWSATFDWLIKDSNMAKVLEGNYDNGGRRQAGKAGNLDDAYQMMREWANG